MTNTEGLDNMNFDVTYWKLATLVPAMRSLRCRK